MIDQITLDIFWLMAEFPDKMFTSGEIARALDENDEIKDKYDLIKVSNRYKYRLKKLCEVGFLCCECINGVHYYLGNVESIWYEEKCDLKAGDETIGMGGALIIRSRNNGYSIYFVNDADIGQKV